MIRRTLIFLLLLTTAFSVAPAQKRYVVDGLIADRQQEYCLMYAAAALLQKDNSVVRSTMTDSLGRFQLVVDKAGDYTLRLSYIGYTTQSQRVKLTDEQDTVHVGIVFLDSEDTQLGPATVTATLARVQQVGDTTQFNADAYRVPEGSTLEALIEQLPGVEVSESGTITWNGKTVKNILVKGKDFFKGDTSVAMKNLPTNIVSKVKAYDKKSDYTEQTGIDDGEEETVLDLDLKRELNQSWILNADIGYGTRERYSDRLFATRFTDNSRITAFASANNVGDRGFGGPRGFGGQSGLTAVKTGGLDFSWENGLKKNQAGRLEVGGNVRYSHSSNDLISRTSSETFLSGGGSSSFGNNRNRSNSHSTNVNGNLRFQWNPDSLTNITLRPSYTHSESRNGADRLSATFNADPYSINGIENPLDSVLSQNADLLGVTINSNNRQSLGSSNSNQIGTNLNITRRLGTNGRNLSFRGDISYNKSRSNSFSISDIHYYTQGTETSSSFLNQYTATPNKNWNYSLRLGYVEPLGKNWFAEARYEYSYRYQDSNRSLYALNNLTDGGWGDSQNHPAIGTLPTEAALLQSVRDDFNSQFAEYKYYNNNVNVGVRYNSSDIRFNAGVSFNPQRTKMQYERPGQNIDTLITRHVFNVSPEVRFRYRFSRTNSLDINYRGSASQPSMTNLLDVVDDSDPLNISMGNPGLKPSWSNSFRAEYRGYNAERLAGINANVSLRTTSNSIATRIVYDDATGVRYSRPENINGNWNIDGRLMYNFSFGPEQLMSLSTSTNVGYTEDVGYVSRMGNANYVRNLFRSYTLYTPKAAHTADYYNSVFENSTATKNKARQLNLGENLRYNYRTSYFNIGATGSLNFQHARNSVQTSGNLDTWLYSYGLTASTTTPWGMEIATDIRMSSRRGYSDRSMNTNELLWNAQLSQGFLTGKPLRISVQFYDILHRQSTVSRVLNAQMRSDTWSNAINSYIMVHVIYRLNIFGKDTSAKSSRGGRGGDEDGPRGGGPGGDGPRGGAPGGGPGGGMGGPGGGGPGGPNAF
ncbi:MAG: outer membrane beta-barrel protein [Alloprevotella sp.]|nr:outer membrane beta-barrel protein [Alloprevotella sp.]